MIQQILSRTPPWVWGLLVALIALGVSQLFARRASLARITLLPVAMLALSLYGTVSVSGFSVPLLALWAAAFCLTAFWLQRRALPAQTRYDAATRRFELPGSVQPLLLILAIFCIKYGVGVWLAMAPAMRDNRRFAVTVVVLYGVFSGLFAGRALRLWRLARPACAVAAPSCRH